MTNLKHKFSIQITTKNRIQDLLFTLSQIQEITERKDVECVIYDDGSVDGTFDIIKKKFPLIKLFRNDKSKGLIFCRNRMLNTSESDYVISLDDDAHFLSENVLENIENYFNENSACGVIATRIFWGISPPISTFSDEKPLRVRGFVGCGHVWNMKAWASVPDYPDWFVFYGEEEFAGYQLFKKKWEIHYVPKILIHHRVDVKGRKKNDDYSIRLRRSLRSGWYLYFLFIPVKMIPAKMMYSLWIQINKKVFRGDLRALKAIVLAIIDLFVNLFRLFKNREGFTVDEYKVFCNLPQTKIYWTPKNETSNSTI
ncbi:glycosyltransferase family 2 protein [Flavobacterium sp. H122]|uniref:glycosyltransferase family 2 protein n=1 Tax=Flavobacterium sp. H122 TaxID=2529860 RepID=UPI00145AC804|nr:glycosyltransferase family 2 protein [Flavobacterium sp. H122]